jgi:hypothetical protein
MFASAFQAAKSPAQFAREIPHAKSTAKSFMQNPPREIRHAK